MVASSTHTSAEPVLLAQEFPELLDGVPADELRRATAASAAAVSWHRPGPWEPPSMTTPNFGLLVLEGLLARRVSIGNRDCVELVGPGDVVRPWTTLDERNSTITVDASWSVQSPVATLAMLDHGFARRIAPWPQMSSSIMDSLARRSRWLAFHLAICHLPSLPTRLHIMLWFLADRWGTVTSDGVVIPLELRHQLLAALIGARRPSTTSAMGRLKDAGHVAQRSDGHYVVLGDPPAELTSMHAASAGEHLPPP